MLDTDRRKLDTAKEALCRLFEADNPLQRHEIFLNPKSGQHFREPWELRFLTFLANNGIIKAIGYRDPVFRLLKDLPQESEAGKILKQLLSDKEMLQTLVLTGKNPLPTEKLEEEEEIQNTEDTELPISPSLNTESNVELGAKLDLIAENLVAVMNFLVYSKEVMEKQAQEIQEIKGLLATFSSEEQEEEEPINEPDFIAYRNILITKLENVEKIATREVYTHLPEKAYCKTKTVSKVMKSLGFTRGAISARPYGKKGSIGAYIRKSENE